MLSIVIPVYNDADNLARLLEDLERQAEALGAEVEVLVVDAGSQDKPRERCLQGCLFFDSDVSGRGGQLAYGVARSSADWIWLLHADSRINAAALRYLLKLRGIAWGRFDVRMSAAADVSVLLRVVAMFMNWRSRLTGICTGDQGMFVHRTLLQRVGGVPAQPLMEDIELSRRLKRLCRPLTPRIAIGTSPRRWCEQGVLRTVLSMWRMRLRYWLGADPHTLARDYYRRA